MKTIEITEKNMRDALKVAKSEEVKNVLSALFSDEVNKPNLDDYTSIKTYEDACEALGENVTYFSKSVPKHIEALMKLETISRALWGNTFQPKPDAEGSTYYYSPWFVLYTKEKIEDMNDDEKGALLSAAANHGATAGFGALDAYSRSSLAAVYTGFRMCQETEEKAIYFGRQFVELWAEYLAFNFVTGERLIK